MTLSYDQEKAILEAIEKLYQICEAFALDDEFAREIRRNIDDALKERTGIDVNEK